MPFNIGDMFGGSSLRLTREALYSSSKTKLSSFLSVSYHFFSYSLFILATVMFIVSEVEL